MWTDIIKIIADISTRRDIMKQEKRDRVSEVLLDISKIISKTVEELKSDIYPVGCCAALLDLSVLLTEKLQDYPDLCNLDELLSKLLATTRLEKEYANRKDPETIRELEEAAGSFQAYAIIFKL